MPANEGEITTETDRVESDRLFKEPDRAIVLFSATRRALGAWPYGTTLAQIQAMTAIWRLVIGRTRHPWDVEWWADAAGDGRRWEDPRRFVEVVRDEAGFEFVERDRTELDIEEAPGR